MQEIQIWLQKDFNPIVLAIAVLAPSLNKKMDQVSNPLFYA